MDYLSVTDPQWAYAAHTHIHCQVQFATFSAPVAFHASPDDPHGHGREIFADCVAGKYGPIADYVPQDVPPDEQYNAAIASGLTFSSATTPALDGTYDVSPVSARSVQEQAQYIALYGEFSSGEPTLDWPDSAGALHTFPDTAHFMAFAKEVTRYVFACRHALVELRAGRAAAFPSNKVTP